MVPSSTLRVDWLEFQWYCPRQRVQALRKAINLNSTFLNEVRLKLDLYWTFLIGATQKVIIITQLMRSLIWSVCHTSIESVTRVRSLGSIHIGCSRFEFEHFRWCLHRILWQKFQQIQSGDPFKWLKSQRYWKDPDLCTTDFVRIIEFNEYLVSDVALSSV